MDQEEKKGSVLLLTLIITMIVLTSSVVLGTLIISSLRRSQGQLSQISAYYAAESLTEKILYDLRKNKWTRKNVDDIAACPGIFGTSLPYTCDASVSNISPSVFGTKLGEIKKNRKVEFKLVDPDWGVVAPQVATLEFHCNPSSAWLEVTAQVISDNSVWISDPNTYQPKKALFSCTTNLTSSYPMTVETDKAYVVEVKSLYNNASAVYVRALKSDNSVVELNDYIVVTVNIDYSNFSRQSIKVQMSGISTASSLFDTVLFSEQAIIKNINPGTS